jgi:thioredoxin reductase
MTVTVDVVVVGANQRAIAAAIAAAQDGRRVLVVTRERGAALHRRLRRARIAAGVAASKRMTVLSGAEVECIAGIRSVEAVLARYVRSGRRVDANTTALLTFEDEAELEERVSKER